MKILYAILSFAAGWLVVTPAPAAVLYDLDFTPPEVGAYQVAFGNPTVQSSVGPFTDALVFHAVTTYDQIQLPINTTGSSYDVQCDVLTHNVLNSNYVFSAYLDTPEVRYVDFNGLSNLFDVFQPAAGANLGNFVNDTVYHLDLAVDLARNHWTVSVNGVQRYANAFNATSLQDIRFSMAPATGNATNAPTVYAALDNVVVTVVPEPGSFALVDTVLLVGWLWLFRQQIRRPQEC